MRIKCKGRLTSPADVGSRVWHLLVTCSAVLGEDFRFLGKAPCMAHHSNSQVWRGQMIACVGFWFLRVLDRVDVWEPYTASLELFWLAEQGAPPVKSFNADSLGWRLLFFLPYSFFFFFSVVIIKNKHRALQNAGNYTRYFITALRNSVNVYSSLFLGCYRPAESKNKTTQPWEAALLIFRVHSLSAQLEHLNSQHCPIF